MLSIDLIIGRSLPCSVICNGVVMDTYTLILSFMELTRTKRKLTIDLYINVLHLGRASLIEVQRFDIHRPQLALHLWIEVNRKGAQGILMFDQRISS